MEKPKQFNNCEKLVWALKFREGDPRKNQEISAKYITSRLNWENSWTSQIHKLTQVQNIGPGVKMGIRTMVGGLRRALQN